MKKTIFIAILTCILISSIVYANSAAYIVKQNGDQIQKYIDIIEDMGFTVDIIDAAHLSSTNFANYTFSVIGYGLFSDISYMPVNKYPCLILNTNNLKDFHWSSTYGTRSGYKDAYINDPSHQITKDMSSISLMYSSVVPYYVLPKASKAVNLKTLASVISDHNDAIVAAAEKGTKLRDNFVSNAKGVFFGLNNYQYWTADAEKIFRNSITWLTQDALVPEIKNLTVESLTNNSAVISWNTEILANTTVNYGKTTSFDLSKGNNSFITTHKVVLNSLEELKTYYYKAQSCSQYGICRQSNILNFTTLDLTAPILISSPNSNTTNSSAVITANISEDANATLYYGTAQSSLTNSIKNTNLAKTHTFTISSLNEKTKYYYKINLCDKYNNCKDSIIYNFTTLDFTAPNQPNNLILTVINDNNHIKISWTPNTDDTAKYNVYIAESTYNFDLNNPSAVVTSSEYIDTDADLYSKRYYIVRAQDAAGNEEENGNIVAKYDLDLVQGYNFVSFPLVPFNMNVSAVMHQDNNYMPVQEIRWFNGVEQKFYINIYDGAWINQFNEMDIAHGYIFKTVSPVKFTIVGYPAAGVFAHIDKGMNLVGLSLLSEKNLSSAIVQSPSNYNITEISAKNMFGSFDVSSYYGSNGWFNEFDVTAGAAYWVKSNKDFILEVTQ